jgi:hypothetical protein
MTISQEQANQLAAAYSSGNTGLQNLVNSMGVTSADVAQYFPSFDVAGAGLTLPTPAPAPVINTEVVAEPPRPALPNPNPNLTLADGTQTNVNTGALSQVNNTATTPTTGALTQATNTTPATTTPAGQLSGVVLAGDSWLANNALNTPYIQKQLGNTPVTNVAIGGTTSTQNLQQLNDFLAGGGSFAPGTTVVLDSGGNDLLTGVSADVVTKNLDTIAKKLGSLGVNVVLSGAPQVSSIADVTGNTNLKLDPLYNTVAANNKNVTVVDSMAGLLNQKNLVDNTAVGQGFHMGDTGQMAYDTSLVDAVLKLQGKGPVSFTNDDIKAFVAQNNLTPDQAKAIAPYFGVSGDQVTAALMTPSASTTTPATTTDTTTATTPTPHSTALAPPTLNDSNQDVNSVYNTIQLGQAKYVPSTFQSRGQTINNSYLTTADGTQLPVRSVENLGGNAYDVQINDAGGIYHMIVGIDANGNVKPIDDASKQNIYQPGQAGGFLKNIAQNVIPIADIVAGLSGYGAFIPAINAGLGLASGQDLATVAKNAALSEAAVLAAPYVGSKVGNFVENALPTTMSDTLASTIGDVAKGASSALTAGEITSQGKADPLQLLTAGGVSAAIPSIAKDIPGYSSLNASSQAAVNKIIGGVLAGANPTQTLINAAISAGTNAAKAQQAKSSTNVASADVVPSSLPGIDTATQAIIDQLGTSSGTTGGTSLASTSTGTMTDAGPVQLGITPSGPLSPSQLQQLIDDKNPNVQYGGKTDDNEDIYTVDNPQTGKRATYVNGEYIGSISLDFSGAGVKVQGGDNSVPLTPEPVTVTGQKDTGVLTPDNTVVPTGTTSSATGANTTLAPVTVTGQKQTGNVVPDNTVTLPASTTASTSLAPVTVVGQKPTATTPDNILPPVTVVGQKPTELNPVTVTGQKLTDNTPDNILPPVTVVGKKEPDVVLPPVTVVGKKEPDVVLPPVTVIGKKTEPDVVLPPVTVIGKKEPDVVTPTPTPTPTPTTTTVKTTTPTPTKLPTTTAGTQDQTPQPISGPGYPGAKAQFLKSMMTQSSFKNPLEKLMQLAEGRKAPEPTMNTQTPTEQSSYYNYGIKPASVESVLGQKKETEEPVQAFKKGGYVAPLSVLGPIPRKDGRHDFRHGAHVAGEGDGQSDDIPAMLADGEFVFPADVVSALGNGSTKAGTDKLYKMMEEIRARARSTKVDDLPPPALKSPLDYLKGRKK